MYEVNPYQGLRIANLSTGVIPGMLQASAPTSMEGSFKSGFDEANAVKDRINKDALSRKLEETFGKMYSPEAKAAQGKLAGYRDAIKGSKDNLKGSQDVIDRLMLELQDEQAKPFQNPEKIAKIKAQLAEVQSQVQVPQGKPTTAEMGAAAPGAINGVGDRQAGFNMALQALAGKTQQEIAADPILTKFQQSLDIRKAPTQEEIYNSYAAPRQGGLKSVVPGYAMSRDEYMQQGSTNSKIEALKAQLADEESKPIQYPGKAEAIQAEIAAEQEKIAKERASVEANSRLLADQEKASKQLIPQAEVLQALAGTNPEKASAEYLDLIQKQQSSGMAGLKYADELKARDSMSSAARGTGEYAGMYEGGATQARLDYNDAKDAIDEATRSGRNPNPNDVIKANKAKQGLAKISSTLISSYPSMAQEATTAFGVKPLDNKEINEAMVKAATYNVINGEDGKSGLLKVTDDATRISAKIANASSSSEVTKELEDYTKLEQQYNKLLAQLDPEAKSALVDKFKFVPVADVINKIQDEGIKREANAAQRAMANAQFAQGQQKFSMEQNQFDFKRVSDQLLNTKLSPPSTYEKIFRDANNKEVATNELVKELSQLIEPGLSVSDSEYGNILSGNPSSEGTAWLKKIGLLGAFTEDKLRERIKVLAKDRHASAIRTVKGTYGENFKVFDPASNGTLSELIGVEGLKENNSPIKFKVSDGQGPVPSGKPGSSKSNPIKVTSRPEYDALPGGTWVKTPKGVSQKPKTAGKK